LGSIKKSGELQHNKSEDRPLKNCQNLSYAAIQHAMIKSVIMALNLPIKNIQCARRCVTENQELDLVSLISVKAASSGESNSSFCSSKKSNEYSDG